MTVSAKTTTPVAPPASPLDMPSQGLRQGTSAAPPDGAGFGASTGIPRLVTFGGALALTVFAAWQMFLTLPVNTEAIMATLSPTMTVLVWLLLGLFSLTFAWISVAATAAVAGFFSPQRRLYAEPDAPLQGRTVLLLPIYNEDAASTCAALAAMGEDLHRLRLHHQFEIFVLSDTNSPELIPAELAAVQCLQEQLSDAVPVWYRRREHNTDRKAGNIRDFIRRWGGRFDYMVVLDADSLVAGETLATLVREMDADSATGILQTLPRVYNSESIFARLQQFSASAYGAVFARGLSAWQGRDGNYWGHNAIIRIRAFADSAGLPALRGPSPFGGEIRSHDFVEAALIRRAGWGVRMMPELKGSWEECPPTLLDAAVRDRRWAQGNMQHLAVVTTRGLRWPSRLHMVMGVMNYLTSLLWLAMVSIGLILSTHFILQQSQSLPDPVPLLDAERMKGLFMLTLCLLLLPKLLGMISGVVSRERRGGLGRLQFVLSALVELVFSILHAPVFMFIHSWHLWQIACGQDSGWAAQQRQGKGRNWRLLLVRHSVHTAIGLLIVGLMLWLSVPLLYWMLPMAAGLVLAIPLSALSGSTQAGRWLARRGLLGTQEEKTPHAIIKRRQFFLEQFRLALSTRVDDRLSLKPSGEKYHLYESYDEKQPRYGRL